MSDILIIGSEGFIGSNLVSHYLGKQWKVTGIDRLDNPSQAYHYNKLLSISDVTEFLLTNKHDYLINAAGSGNVGFSVMHPISDFEANCFDTAKILDAIRVSGHDTQYVHISSAAVYGNPEKLPVQENDPLHPLSPYGWHKLISEYICKEYLELYNLRLCIVRPFSVYGPGLRKQLFWDLYHKSSRNNTVELFGTGRESRDFIYVADLVKAIDIIIERSPMKGECYNIASGNETFIAQATELFASYFDPTPLISFNGHTKVGDPANWRADISRLSSLGFKPSMSIESGLKLTFDWINKTNI